MYKNKRIGVIIPAAGSGKRLGKSVAKTWLDIEGRPMIAWTIEAFLHQDWIDEIVLVTKEETVENLEALCKTDLAIANNRRVNSGELSIKTTSGGAERVASVYNGLKEISEEVDYVLVHDGARPLLSEEVLERILEDVVRHGTSVACVPSKDTVKIATDDQHVDYTPDRSRVFSVQTPQAFEKEMLLRAYEQGRLEGAVPTDDSSLVEALGVKVKLTLGSYENIKVTTEEDLMLAIQLMTK